jgi:hypothetical protein
MVGTNGKGKAREVGRQTTLFGHGLRTSGAPKITAPIAQAKIAGSALSGSSQPEVEDETQLEEDTQLVDDAEEMTPDIVSGATTVLASGEDDEEPVEWPESPGPADPPVLHAD